MGLRVRGTQGRRFGDPNADVDFRGGARFPGFGIWGFGLRVESCEVSHL